MHRGCCGVQLLRAYIAASLPFKTKATWRAMNPQQRFDAVAKYKNVAACSAICLVIFCVGGSQHHQALALHSSTSFAIASLW
jgi:hypothetical protein